MTANNSSFVSILFKIELTDNDTGQKAKLHNAMTFNLKNGKVLQLKDLFADGFESSLSSAINDKFKQFGLPQVDKFDAIVKQQNFYMENDSIIFIYNKGEASNFADGEVFIPFLLTDLIGILK